MPMGLVYLGIMLGTILVWFLVLRRPVYEAVFISFVVLLFATGTYMNVWEYVNAALSTNLLYTMTAFVAMSIILTKTKIIDGCVAIILSLLGRVTGGAGYVAVVASAFMGALSGSGPGNIMATGTLTVPAMKRSGFPAHLAANISSNASYMGNMIPPSSNILAAMEALALTALMPEEVSQGKFWTVLWVISLWFILQRIVMVFLFCKYYKVKPMEKSELPRMREVIKTGWQGMLLPLVILLPFVLDAVFKDTFFTARLGAAGAKYLSNSLLLFIPGVAALYNVLIAKDKTVVTPHKIAKMFAGGVKTIAPSVGVCVVGYMIGAMFKDLGVAAQLLTFVQGFAFSKFGMVLFVCVISCVLGMIIPGSSIVVTFGPTFIAALAAVGVDPLLAAAMLPCICGVMCGITPPLGLGLYAGMTIAESDFSKTFNNNLWWVAAQFVMQVVVLMGWLPIFGL